MLFCHKVQETFNSNPFSNQAQKVNQVLFCQFFTLVYFAHNVYFQYMLVDHYLETGIRFEKNQQYS